MNKTEIESLIEATAQRTAMKVVEQLKGIVRIQGEEDEEYVDSKTAAQILGVTPNYLRAIKNHFKHKKVGSSTQGKILFLRSSLMQSYLNH